MIMYIILGIAIIITALYIILEHVYPLRYMPKNGDASTTFFSTVSRIVDTLLSYMGKTNLRKKFKGDYFDWDNEAFDFTLLPFIRQYWDTKNKTEGIKNSIDDTTWNDLDMDHLFLKMNATQSSVGEEYLYSKLRTVTLDEKELQSFGALMDFLDNNPNIKIEILCATHTLGKNPSNNVSSYIYKIGQQPIKNIKVYYFHMLLPIISGIVCLFTPVGFVLLVASFIINTHFYYKNKFRLEMNLGSISYISKIVYCAYKLSKLNFKELGYEEIFRQTVKPLRRLSYLGNTLLQKTSSDFDFIFEYIKIILMWDFINYNKIITILSKHTQNLHCLYKLIGELDCAAAICSFRKSLDIYCTPQFYLCNDIVYDQVYHPLIKNPVPNSVCWNKNSIITGSNASGKSTFIKALAITALCAQSIYLCFCKEYKSKMSCVVTSMAVKDNVCNNESYFIAELKSLKRILDNVTNKTRIICFIDEILKGTNTIERVCASAAILGWLSEKKCIVMTASHDMELTEMLRSTYNNYHFKEHLTDNSISFDYKLYHGVSKTRNAIKLLKVMGYDEQILESALCHFRTIVNHKHTH